MARAPTDLRSLARAHTEMALRTLAGVASSSENDAARVSACVHLLDRGWGKPPQAHTGEDGEGDIRITIRHIMEGTNVPVRTVPDRTLPAIDAPEDATPKVINGSRDL